MIQLEDSFIDPSLHIPRWQEPQKRRLRKTWIICSASLLVVAFLVGPASHSTGNDLLFFFAKEDSPLKNSHVVGLTKGVVPRRVHSHNDYEQRIPLYEALSYGAASVEADIWETDGQDLLVGHTKYQLTPTRTLSSLYIEPLMKLLSLTNADHEEKSMKGVFDVAPSLPLYLLIDIKTSGPSTFEKLYVALEPLRKAGYLSTLSPDMSFIIPSAVTVIGTGNTPLESIQALGHSSDRPRDVFLDAPLSQLFTDIEGAFNHTVSPLASADFVSVAGLTWPIPILGTRALRGMIDTAHQRGIQTRFWNTPITPTWIRNMVWQLLLDQGSDWINVDDLVAASRF